MEDYVPTIAKLLINRAWLPQSALPESQMALNWAMLSATRTPIPLPHELTIRTVDSGAELTLIVPDAPPASTASSGGSGGSKKLKELGRLSLTDQRLIFVTDAAGGGKVSFQSLSVPLTSIVSTKFEQPYLGSNYLVVDIRPVGGGGLTDGTKAEVRFKNKGIFEFASVLDKTRERAVYMRRQSADEEEGLPLYSTPGDTPGPSYSHPTSVPEDSPPGYEA